MQWTALRTEHVQWDNCHQREQGPCLSCSLLTPPPPKAAWHRLDVYGEVLIKRMARFVLWFELCAPQNFYSEVLTPSTLECDFMWRWGLSKGPNHRARLDFLQKGESGDRYARREHSMCRWRQRTRWCFHEPSSNRDAARQQSNPTEPLESSPQGCEIIHFCYLKLPSGLSISKLTWYLSS